MHIISRNVGREQWNRPLLRQWRRLSPLLHPFEEGAVPMILPLDGDCVGFPRANRGYTQRRHRRRPRRGRRRWAHMRPRERPASEDDQGGGQCSCGSQWMLMMGGFVGRRGADSATAEEVVVHFEVFSWYCSKGIASMQKIPTR